MFTIGLLKKQKIPLKYIQIFLFLFYLLFIYFFSSSSNPFFKLLYKTIPILKIEIKFFESLRVNGVFNNFKAVLERKSKKVAIYSGC